MNDDNATLHSSSEFNPNRSTNTASSKISAASGSTGQDDDSEQENYPLIQAFQALVILFGAVGFVMNGLVLKSLLSKRLRRNTSTTLLTNQVVMDTVSSLLLIVVYTCKNRITDVYYEGTGGFLLCIFLNSDIVVFAVQVGSIANLVVIAAERYFKVVHPLLHKRHYRSWMTGAGIAFTWTNGILLQIASFFTTKIENGICYVFEIWPQKYSPRVYSHFLVTWQFLVPLLLFVFFYGSILLVVRRRGRVFHGATHHVSGDTANGVQQKRGQMDMIFTMITISFAFALCWAPNQIHVIIVFATLDLDFSPTYYYVSMLMIFFNTCLNPFIYASRHEAVRKNLKEMLQMTKATIEITAIT